MKSDSRTCMVTRRPCAAIADHRPHGLLDRGRPVRFDAGDPSLPDSSLQRDSVQKEPRRRKKRVEKKPPAWGFAVNASTMEWRSLASFVWRSSGPAYRRDAGYSLESGSAFIPRRPRSSRIVFRTSRYSRSCVFLQGPVHASAFALTRLSRLAMPLGMDQGVAFAAYITGQCRQHLIGRLVSGRQWSQLRPSLAFLLLRGLLNLRRRGAGVV